VKIFVGLPMHNAADCVIKTLEHAAAALQAVGAYWCIQIVDDNSDPAELQKVRDYLFNNPNVDRLLAGNVSIAQAALLWPGSPAPNLGRALNWCLKRVGPEIDYYLNIESDVYLQHDAVWNLIQAMEETGAPMACPRQLAYEHPGCYDFIFWVAGIISAEALEANPGFAPLRSQSRPKWCNLGCLMVRGNVARSTFARVDEQFTLFCVDQDYTSTVAQMFGRPVYEPKAIVTHVGRQSTREGQPGGHTAHDAVLRINAKWSEYLSGGLFGP